MIKSVLSARSYRMAADPLSEILDLLNARCLLSGGMSAGGPWIRRFAQPNAIKVMAMLEGSCWLLMDGSADNQFGSRPATSCWSTVSTP